MKNTKRIFAVILSLLMIIGYTQAAFAVGGTVGSITWYYDESAKTLTIGGSGNMPNYTDDNAPWYIPCKNGGCESVVINSAVTSVGKYCFANLKNIKNVTIPDSVMTIDNNAFTNCGGLESFTIGNNVKTIGDGAFSNCDNMTTVTIGDGVEKIGGYAFSNCYKLVTVNGGKNVKEIGNSAFYSCQRLKYVSIGNNVTTIGNYAFENCSELKTVNYQGTKNQWNKISMGEYVFGISTAGGKIHHERSESQKLNFIFAAVKSVSANDMTINYKETAAIKLVIDADEGVEYTVSFSSSKPSVVSVDNNGNVTSNKTSGFTQGSATITVTVTDSNGNTVTDTCTVTVQFTWWQWLIKIVLFGWIWY